MLRMYFKNICQSNEIGNHIVKFRKWIDKYWARESSKSVLEKKRSRVYVEIGRKKRALERRRFDFEKKIRIFFKY